MDLKTPLKDVGITYKMQARKLEKLGLYSIEDLLYYVPARYDDYSLISPIGAIQPGETVTIKGKVISSKNEYTRGRFVIQKIVIEDETGSIACIWFNQPYIVKNIKDESLVSISGKVDYYRNNIVMQPKEYEILENIEYSTYHTGRIIPTYSETRGLSSKWIRNRIKELLKKNKSDLIDHIPSSIIEKYNLMGIQDAIEQIHFPESLESALKSKQRLSFDELFLTQLYGLVRKDLRKKQTTTIIIDANKYNFELQRFIARLPFSLTSAQEKTYKEILLDLNSNKPMNRLLQGDVGSGKTVVATIAMYAAYLNGYKSVIMAPTEILAQQHFDTISKLLGPFGVSVGLQTGSKKFQISSIRKTQDKNFKFQILIGTHALLNENLSFDNFGLVVIDEQQRFGVKQRSFLREKAVSPHFLTMSATPIPRTMVLTLYGDLDASYLDEMPKGRKKIKTWLVPPEKRLAAYDWIKKKLKEKDEIGSKNQVFIICPFIEESENMTTIKAATKEYETLKKDVFYDFKLGLLHGKIKQKDKDIILEDFRNQKIDVLVATPVVEVGIDIPNATIIVIEAAERFGLSQLHQLRGRVGRNERESFCLLFTESKSRTTLDRLKSLETIHLGAELAELDLKLRGPGEVFGTKQHGQNMLKVASFSDFELIEQTRAEAEKIFKELNKHPLLQARIKQSTLESISPD